MRHQNTLQPKTDFGQPPTGYVAGLGRGATGFITRCDIGPAKLNEPIVQQHRVQDDEMEDYNDAKYDEWNGYSVPLFNMGDYDDEDREADQLYQLVDEHLDGRRRTRKERLFKEELKRIQSERPSIANQFADLKRDLARITAEEWKAIPQGGDYSIKKVKRERYTPVPDAIIQQTLNDAKNSFSTTISGTPGQIGTTNLSEIGEARGTLLSLKLDGISDNVSGQSVVDTKGYLTNLSSVHLASESEIGDFKKARLLAKSLIQANPKSSFGWLAAARVEELDKKLNTARNILAQGLQQVEDAEDLYIELARLEKPEKAKQILAKAISVTPNSVKIWLASANKENDRMMKCKVLKRALEYIPNSEVLWKELIELSSESEAKVLLHRAVECIPTKLEFWLALAKLEDYENAKAVLNKARQYLPQEPSVWIHAAKLEESYGKEKAMITTILQKGIKVLAKNGVKIVREDWLHEAELSEKSENYQTCYALVNASVGYGLAPEQLFTQWVSDAQLFESRGSIFTARAIYTFAVETLQAEKEEMIKLWIKFEEKYSWARYPNQQQSNEFKDQCFLDIMLEQSIKLCPNTETFWVQNIMRKWQIGQIDIARQLIQQSLQPLPSNENLMVLSAKLEMKSGNFEYAKQILNSAKQDCNGLKSWLWLIKVLSFSQELNEAEKLSEEACKKFPQSEKSWTIWARVKQKQGKMDEARRIYDQAVNKIPESVKLWLHYIELECSQGLFQRARPLIEKARSRIPKSPELWVASIKLEIDSGMKKGAVFMLSKALQECPRNGELWSLAIELEPMNTRKKKSADAISICVDDPQIYLSTAKIFWKELKHEKCKKWLEKAILLNPRLGDAWAYLYLLMKSIEKVNTDELVRKCQEKKPKDGRLWRKVKKSEAGFRMSTQEILDEVAKLVEQEMNQLE